MQNLFSSKSKNAKKIAVLIDPDKFSFSEDYVNNINLNSPDYIFVGGSGFIDNSIFQKTVLYLKENTSIPVIIFPGDNSQRSVNADGLLLLSVFQSEKKEYIIGQLISVASQLIDEKVPLYPTLYVLMDGQKKTSTLQVLDINIPQLPNSFEDIKNYIISAKILKYQYIYLEAGSGAKKPVTCDVIRKAKNILKNECLIVGGGIQNSTQLMDAYKAGSDIVVVGNILEKNPDLLSSFIKIRNSFNIN